MLHEMIWKKEAAERNVNNVHETKNKKHTTETSLQVCDR